MERNPCAFRLVDLREISRKWAEHTAVSGGAREALPAALGNVVEQRAMRGHLETTIWFDARLLVVRKTASNRMHLRLVRSANQHVPLAAPVRDVPEQVSARYARVRTVFNTVLHLLASGVGGSEPRTYCQRSDGERELVRKTQCQERESDMPSRSQRANSNSIPSALLPRFTLTSWILGALPGALLEL